MGANQVFLLQLSGSQTLNMGTAMLSVQLQPSSIFVWNHSSYLRHSVKCLWIVEYARSQVEAGHSIRASAAKPFCQDIQSLLLDELHPLLCPVLPDLACHFCLSCLVSGTPRRPTFPPHRPRYLSRPHPLLVTPDCIRPLILSSTGLLPTPCGCACRAGISATIPPLAI